MPSLLIADSFGFVEACKYYLNTQQCVRSSQPNVLHACQTEAQKARSIESMTNPHTHKWNFLTTTTKSQVMSVQQGARVVHGSSFELSHCIYFGHTTRDDFLKFLLWLRAYMYQFDATSFRMSVQSAQSAYIHPCWERARIAVVSALTRPSTWLQKFPGIVLIMRMQTWYVHDAGTAKDTSEIARGVSNRVHASSRMEFNATRCDQPDHYRNCRYDQLGGNVYDYDDSPFEEAIPQLPLLRSLWVTFAMGMFTTGETLFFLGSLRRRLKKGCKLVNGRLKVQTGFYDSLGQPWLSWAP